MPCMLIDLNEDDGAAKLVGYSPSGMQYPWYDYLAVRNYRQPRTPFTVDNLSRGKSLLPPSFKLLLA